MIALNEAYQYMHIWNGNDPEPRWFEDAQAPTDIMNEYSDKYMKVYLGSWYNVKYHVYLYDNSTIQLKDLFIYIMKNYKAQEL